MQRRAMSMGTAYDCLASIRHADRAAHVDFHPLATRGHQIKPESAATPVSPHMPLGWRRRLNTSSATSPGGCPRVSQSSIQAVCPRVYLPTNRRGRIHAG